MKSVKIGNNQNLRSRIPRGMRGLKSSLYKILDYSSRSRIPRGMRGLKYYVIFVLTITNWSHPARDAWIEIPGENHEFAEVEASHPARDAWIEIWLWIDSKICFESRIPRGMRGLKWVICNRFTRVLCRIPRGMRGLKCNRFKCTLSTFFSRIPRGMRGLKSS